MSERSEVSGVMYAPKVLDRGMHGDQLVWIVESPTEMNRDHPEIIGQEVLLAWDGEAKVYRVKAVHRHLPATPIYPGERIALIVEPTAE